MRIMISKYSAGANARDSLDKGDKAIWTSRAGKVVEVVIDSTLMKHASLPGDGLGFECIFSDTGERGFASADQLTIVRPADYGDYLREQPK